MSCIVNKDALGKAASRQQSMHRADEPDTEILGVCCGFFGSLPQKEA